MTNGTSQGLFIVVAIVIFGIFVGLTYTIFGDTLSPQLQNMFNQSIETVDLRSGNTVDTGNHENIEEYPTPTDSSLFTYVENSTGTTITKYLGTDVNVVIPQEIEGKSVTEIGDYAFYSGTNINKNPIKVDLESVVIPNSVTKIGTESFIANKITEINIPDSVALIGNFSFSNNQLTDASIPNSVITIGNYAFSSNQLTTVIIPNSVIAIGVASFNSNQLTSVTIPNSVATIGDTAFMNNNLTEVELHVNTSYIADRTFDSGVVVKTRP